MNQADRAIPRNPVVSPALEVVASAAMIHGSQMARAAKEKNAAASLTPKEVTVAAGSTIVLRQP